VPHGSLEEIHVAERKLWNTYIVTSKTTDHLSSDSLRCFPRGTEYTRIIEFRNMEFRADDVTIAHLRHGVFSTKVNFVVGKNGHYCLSALLERYP
jgi:hypothetical protein